MINFKAHLKVQPADRKTNPQELYNSLDRAVDKGPLRPAQEFILQEWFSNRRDDRNIIIKLHTGQGKTLIGLLMLLSQLNQGKGPSIYLCPNNYLVTQTCNQASQFGIPYCEISDDIPPEFIDGKKLLITSVQRLFNGLSKFGLGFNSILVSTILVDDAHTCIESIKDACTIEFKRDDSAYSDLLALFSQDLEMQGAGTFADIKNESYDAIQYVPYWAWQAKQSEVINILSKNKELNNVKFAWPLIKDIIANCICVISGQKVEISPSIIPLHLFGSFSKADHRIFMSATFFDDSFLVKGFEIPEQAIQNPLVFPSEKWAGEKMVLIPSLIDEKLDRSLIVEFFSGLIDKKFGIVVLCTSFGRTKDWESYGCTIAKTDNILASLSKFKNMEFNRPLVFANRYDGIDLPDQMCRFLIIDSKPYSGSLYDRYMQCCRSNSIIIESKIAQTIEQGMGRAVRGEKDYCAVILIGPELIKAIHSSKSRRLFSIQTRTQIEIGLEISEIAKEDVTSAKTPLQIFIDLLNQLLRRDDGWKEFYIERMNEMDINKSPDNNSLKIILLEKQSEKAFLAGDPQKAAEYLQLIIDSCDIPEDEKGWYLQEIARIIYTISKSDSNKLQIAAHKKNHFLLKPQEGMHFAKLEKLSQKRVESIQNWIKDCGSFIELQLRIQEILSAICFGTQANRFERALDQLGVALGFETQQPDKEWKEGPDNLWLVEDNKYLLFECKSEVNLSRSEIHKDETGQMNNSISWFERQYGNRNALFFQIIPTKIISKAAGYTREVQIIRDNNLRKLTHNVRSFYREFERQNFANLSVEHINSLLVTHNLTINDFSNLFYSEKPKQL